MADMDDDNKKLNRNNPVDRDTMRKQGVQGMKKALYGGDADQSPEPSPTSIPFSDPLPSQSPDSEQDQIPTQRQGQAQPQAQPASPLRKMQDMAPPAPAKKKPAPADEDEDETDNTDEYKPLTASSNDLWK